MLLLHIVHNSICFITVFYLRYLFHSRPTLYIGEHAGGLYALPSLVEEGSPLVEVRITAMIIILIPFFSEFFWHHLLVSPAVIDYSIESY